MAQRGGSTAKSWAARWRDPDSGRPVQVSLDALGLRTAEARRAWAISKSQALAKRRADLAAGAVRHSERELATAVADYLKHSEATKRASTVAAARPPLARFLEWATRRGLRLADEVHPHDLAAFREFITAAKRTEPAPATKRGTRREAALQRLSPVSVNSYLKAVKACLNHLRRVGLLPHVASEEQLSDALRPVRVPKEEPEVLSAVEVQRLLRSALAHDAATFAATRSEHAGDGEPGSTRRYQPVAPFVCFVLLTGARLSEALSLEWRDVDLLKPDDQGRPVGGVRITAAKSKTDSARWIGLEVSPALRRLLTALHLRSGGAGRVFAWLTEPSLKRAQERLTRVVPERKGQAAGFGAPRFAWHTLRRTCGTFLVCAPSIYGSAGVFLAAKQLGHSVEVAEKSYLGRVRGIPHGLATLEDVFGIVDLVARVTREASGGVGTEDQVAEREVARA